MSLIILQLATVMVWPNIIPVLVLVLARPDIIPLHGKSKSSAAPQGILQGIFANHLEL